MAVTVRGAAWGGSSANTSELLVAYLTDRIRALEPDLQYARLGVRRDAPKGFDRILFPQVNQIPVKMNVNINSSVTSFGSYVGGGLGGSVMAGGNTSVEGQADIAPGAPVSSTAGVAAIVEGTNPTSVTWGATSYGSGPFQFGILIQVSDLLVNNSAIEVVDACSEEVTKAMARLVDTVIQTVVNAGVNGVIYAGGKTSRTTLAAGDIVTQTEMVKGVRNLRAANGAGVKAFEGRYYVAVTHPNVMADLMSNSQTGAWQDMSRYSSVDDVKAGKMGDFRGIRYLESAYQNYFNSTTAVYPTTLIGDQSFGWGYFQQPTPILVTTPDSNNPLNLFTSIGGKVTLGVTRFEDKPWVYRVVRVESAASA
jgi:N4-gp56 family major capsid protein